MKRSLWLGFTLLAILGTLAIWVMFKFLTWLKGLDPAITAASVTAMIGLIGLWFSLWHSKSRDIAESHRSSKIEVYSIFFDIVEKFQKEDSDLANLEEGTLPDWLKEDFTKLNRGMLLWASPKVITAWLKFRRESSLGGANILHIVDEVYQAIRSDLGNSNVGLKKGDLIRLSLKNPDELI